VLALVVRQYQSLVATPSSVSGADNLRILVYLVIYDSGWVSLDHLLLSWYPSQSVMNENPLSQPALSLSSIYYYPLASGEGTTYMDLKSFALKTAKPRPESGLDWLICTKFWP